ncbi:MAG: hypothetical protein R3F11_09030 [Verrucomicrobiales bacterium]
MRTICIDYGAFHPDETMTAFVFTLIFSMGGIAILTHYSKEIGVTNYQISLGQLKRPNRKLTPNAIATWLFLGIGSGLFFIFEPTYAFFSLLISGAAILLSIQRIDMRIREIVQATKDFEAECADRTKEYVVEQERHQSNHPV